MATISELRQRSRVSKELQELRTNKVKEVVTDVINSSAFTLTAVNQGNVGEAVSKESVKEFATQVADEVAKAISDPKSEFMDACKARGLKPSRIRAAVNNISELFDLEPDGTYDDKVEAVAIYMSQHPSLYDDLALLK